MKILVVEDAESDLQEIHDAAELYKDKHGIPIELQICKTVDAALKEVDDTFHGAIVDLKLKDDGDGNEVLRHLKSSFRIPIQIVTGTPHRTDAEFKNLKPIRKGKALYRDVIHDFVAVNNTGLLNILGGRGLIEERIKQVFWKLYPDISLWKSYNEHGEDTEKSLLRITVNHLDSLLSNGDEYHIPEEFYNYNIEKDCLKTGALLSNTTSKKNYVTLSPACDLARRNGGKIKTDSILICEIEQIGHIKSKAIKDIKKAEKIRSALSDLFRNNSSLYHHWLPPFHELFKGGFINFRKITSVTENDLNSNFTFKSIHIANPYVKDIVSRFSSYYGRQGQPDLNSKDIVSEHLELATNASKATVSK